ncbi:MAG: DUF748 domain-containing protein [Bacteroidota bacterium]|nr:DUF748 domain-containing protein [Bacteroidota bacterium]MDP4194443.1 DUF748 domain-containing protein [Bacteroidota bacterium]
MYSAISLYNAQKCSNRKLADSWRHIKSENKDMDPIAKIIAKIGKTTFIILIILVVLLVALRIALPYIAKSHINKMLANTPGYRGHVEDVDISLLRGAYALNDIVIKKATGKIPVPFFEADRLELSLQWSELFHGAIVGKIFLDHPQVNFVQGPTPRQSQTKVDKETWQEAVQKLMPLKINRFEINDGEIHFRNFHSDPKVNVYIQELNLVATNLTNSRKISKTLAATLDVTGLALKSGRFHVRADIDPYETKPTFKMTLEMKGLQLVSLNDFLRAYGKFDVHKGTFSLYSEVAASKGKFDGYAKPLLKDVEVVKWKEDIKKPFFKFLWKTVVGAVKDIFTNAPKDQVATRIPISGRLDNPDIGIWTTIWELIKNAFIQALMPGLDKTVNLKTASSNNKDK